jgi:hypothetical protein
MRNSMLSRLVQLVLSTCAMIALGAVIADNAHAQSNGTILVDSYAPSPQPASVCKTLTLAGVGTVEMCATVAKPAGLRGYVDLYVRRLSLSLNGWASFAGILQCGDAGGGQLIVNRLNIRPVFLPYTERVYCPNSLSPVVFLSDIGLRPF